MSQLAMDFSAEPRPAAVFYAVTDAQRIEARERGLPNAQYPVVVFGNGPGTVEHIDTLFQRLAEAPLDPRFLPLGGYVFRDGDGRVRFFGNFFEWSHGFQINCLEGCEIARRLEAAIEANMASPAFEEARSEHRVADEAWRKAIAESEAQALERQR